MQQHYSGFPANVRISDISLSVRPESIKIYQKSIKNVWKLACSPNLCLCGQHQSAALVSLRWLTTKCTQLCLISCLIYYVYEIGLLLCALIGVKGRTKFLNFNSGTCMPSHVTKIRWSVKTIYPQDRPKYCRTNTPKPNGGPLDEKIFFFQKLSLIIFKTLPNDCICQADSEKVYNMGS